MNEAKEKLLVALGARLELSERDVAHAAVEWLEVTSTRDSPPALREACRVRALGEVWRRERLRDLYSEVRAAAEVARDRMVYFLALDECDPRSIPSFVEWLDEREPGPGATIPK